MNKYVFDSYAIIAFFENERGAEQVEEALRELFSNKARGWMSIVNWGEVYYNTCREQGHDVAEKVILQLSGYPIELVNVDQALTKDAAMLKAKYPVAYADCFAAALARSKGAEVLTGDPEFRIMQDEVSILWLQ